MSSPRPAPIYAWGEKPGPSRIEEEEEDRRPPEEEQVEETVPVPVPSTSVPTREEESLPSTEDSLAMAREALRFVQSFVRNPRQETEEKLLFAAETIDGFHLFREPLLSEAVQTDSAVQYAWVGGNACQKGLPWIKRRKSTEAQLEKPHFGAVGDPDYRHG
ncbi:UNVERIFIED_CONTAM: hypothetical protein K2H54_006423 [Gekko kuhli]